MDSAALTTLLYQRESETLDFKEQQYHFYGGATDIEKSELLKDILAFANAWKSADACILVGVRETISDKADVVGLTEHLKDSDLQQFVNSKTNRAVTFLVESVHIDGKDIDVIAVARAQRRPIFLAKDFGGLRRDVVYIRRGSSTAIAGIDEIAEMGAASSVHELTAPIIEFEFAKPHEHERLGREVEVSSFLLVDPPPRSGKPGRSLAAPRWERTLPAMGVPVGFSAYRVSPKELRSYYQCAWLLTPLGFWVHNAGSVTATNVRVEMKTNSHEGVSIVDEWNKPSKPRDFPWVMSPIHSDIVVTEHGGFRLVRVDLGNVQPKAEYWTDPGLHVGAKSATDIVLEAKIFADNLRQPVLVMLKIAVRTAERIYRDVTEPREAEE